MATSERETGAARERRGETAPSNFRLGEQTLSDLDLVAERYSLSTRTAAIKYLAGQAAATIRGTGGKGGRKKTS